MSKLLSKKELRTLVLYSDEHIRRLEKAGRFPGRIRIGHRVGWLEDEVLEWRQQFIDERNAKTAAP